MPSPASGRRRALQAAAELLDELDVDQEQPIDVFDAIERLGLWLVFQPIDTFLGAVIPQGSGGIMITTQRRPTIQRYTAAHELGHWRLEHDPLAIDTAREIFETTADEKERVAQLFASYFLMPPPLVHAAASRNGLTTGAEMSPAQAYLIARDMRVSYEAALRQMGHLGIVSDAERDALLNVQPIEIKQGLAHGHRPVNRNADVWPLDARTSYVHRLDVTIEDEIVIALPENRTTGHRWLDETANAQRGHSRARPAPAAFAAPESSPPPHGPIRQRPASSGRTAADVSAALALLPGPALPATSQESPEESDERAPLVVVSDDFQPGWADVSSQAAAQLRRRIAGAEVPLQASLDSSSASWDSGPGLEPLPGALDPGIGATGQRWLTLRTCEEGQHDYALYYVPPHDAQASPIAVFTVEANIQPLPEVLNRRFFLDISFDDGDDQLDIGIVDDSTDHD